MATRLLKCYGECEQKYPVEQLFKTGGVNYCLPCLKKKEKEKTDRELLYKTIQLIFKVPYPTGQMLRQIKEFKEMRNYDYEGMTKTLCYIVKILKITPQTKYGLGLFPYHYDNAVKYYKDLEEKRNTTGEITSDIDVVKMTPLKHSTESVLKRVFISMEGLS